jgi:hypothetical protein
MAWWFLGFGWCNLWHPSTRRFGLEDSTWDWRSEDHRTAIREQHGTNCRFLTASHWTSVEKMEKEVQVCRLFNTTRLVSWRQSTRMCKPIYNKDNRKRLPRYIYPIYPYYFFVYPSIHLSNPTQSSISIYLFLKLVADLTAGRFWHRRAFSWKIQMARCGLGQWRMSLRYSVQFAEDFEVTWRQRWHDPNEQVRRIL